MSGEDIAALRAELAAIKTKVQAEDPDEYPDARLDRHPRFQKMHSRAKAAEEGLAAMEARIRAAESAQEQAFHAFKAESAASIGQLAARHAEDLGLVQAGFDDAGRAELRRFRGTLPEPEQARPIMDWWTDTTKDPDAARSVLPRTLLPYLPEPPAADASPAPRAAAGVRIGGVSVDQGAAPARRGPDLEKIAAATTPAELFAAIQAASQGRR